MAVHHHILTHGSVSTVVDPTFCSVLPAAFADPLHILGQIAVAFNKPPDAANIFHGQRRIRQGGKGRRTALFSSTKCGGAVPVESKLELAHAVALERSSSVIRFRTQALRIPLSERCFAYPDFLVEVDANRFEVHEIKPRISHISNDDARRFERIEHTLRCVGIAFRLVDATSLECGRALDESLLIYTRGHAERYGPIQISLALDLLSSLQLNGISDAYKTLHANGLPLGLADYLSFHGKWITPNKAATRSGVTQ